MTDPSTADRKRLLFCSWNAFDPATWAVLERLSTEHRFSATVFAPPRVRVDRIYSPTGHFTPDLVNVSSADLRLLPLIDAENPTHGFDPDALKKELANIDPDAIWIHGEPTDGLTRQILKHFYFRRRIMIGCFLAENRWRQFSIAHLIISKILCRRIDALLACGSASAEDAYRVFMPRSVESFTIFMPNFDPRDSVAGSFPITRKPGEFWIGFVGRISVEKGWRVLLDAVSRLPETVKTVIAGDGPEMQQLEAMAGSAELADRVLLAGPLAPPEVRALYKEVDAVVVPSLTTARWAEQFGRVIAEAMAAGKPVVGSRSGAIPEVIGNAGLVVDEGDSEGLAKALRSLLQDDDLRDRLGQAARLRFEQEFSVDVYAARLAKILESR